MDNDINIAPRILIAVDDPDLRRVSVAGLRSAGFSVSASLARSGAACSPIAARLRLTPALNSRTSAGVPKGSVFCSSIEPQKRSWSP